MPQYLTYPVWLKNAPGLQLKHLSTAGSTLLKTGSGVIRSISVNTAATITATDLTIYDGIDATGQIIAVIDVSRTGTEGLSGAAWPFTTGLFVNLSGTADITIVYN